MIRSTDDIAFPIVDNPVGHFTIFSRDDDALACAARLNAEVQRRGGRAEFEAFRRRDGKVLVTMTDRLDEVCFHVPADWAE